MNSVTMYPNVNIVEGPDVKEYTISEVAGLLKVDRSTVWRWIQEERFDGARRKGFGETSPWAIPEPAVHDVADQLGLDLEENGNVE